MKILVVGNCNNLKNPVIITVPFQVMWFDIESWPKNKRSRVRVRSFPGGRGDGGVLLGILGGGMPPSSPNHHYVDYNSNKEDLLKSICYSHIFLSFLIIWDWNVVASKTLLEIGNEVYTRF